MLRQVRKHLLGSAAIAVDAAVTLAVETGSRRQPVGPSSHPERRKFFERVLRDCEALTEERCFALPEETTPPRVVATRAERGLSLIDLRWPSHHELHFSELAGRYGQSVPNRSAHARLFRGERPRPVAVIVHGYMSGSYVLEPLLWPLAELDARGFDVALFVLPFHGLRRTSAKRFIPEFPSADPRMVVEGFRQAVSDLRGLLRWLKREGHPNVGLFGMSLGGYTAALTATIESNLSFLVPVLPLSSMPQLAQEQGMLSLAPDAARLEYQLLERVYRSVSPLARTPLIEPDRVLVIGGQHDRITPISHAEKLAQHFRAPLVRIPGGHLLQFGRRAAFQRALELIAQASGVSTH